MTRPPNNLRPCEKLFPYITRLPTGKRDSSKLHPCPLGFGSLEDDLVYEPSALDDSSFDVGLAKYAHDWVVGDESEVQKMIDYLDEHFSELPIFELNKIDSIRMLDLRKSSGKPWHKLGSTKGDVLCKIFKKSKIELEREIDSSDEFCLEVYEYFEKYHENNPPIYGTALKDELRVKGKDARVFSPAPMEMVILGNALFGEMNNWFVEQGSQLKNEVAVGLEVPSERCRELFLQFDQPHDLDGGAWDANVYLTALVAIREFRKKHSKEPEKVDDYYSNTYVRYVLTRYGHIIMMFGQVSGSTLTTIDNSLIHVATIRSKCKFYCCGDDLIVEKADIQIKELVKYYLKRGMYLETDTFETKQIEDCIFLGMHLDKNLRLQFNEDRLLTACNYGKRNTTYLNEFSRLCAIALLLYNSPKYAGMCSLIREWLHEHKRELECCQKQVQGMSIALDPKECERMYNR
jgi:hypothetical protein